MQNFQDNRAKKPEEISSHKSGPRIQRGLQNVVEVFDRCYQQLELQGHLWIYLKMHNLRFSSAIVMWPKMKF